MKTLNMRRMLSAVLTGVALAAITQVSFAARDVRASPPTLYMEDASGNPFRLVQVEGAGWKYAEGWKSPDRASGWLFRKTASSSAQAPIAKAAVANDEPLTVFIDGPSGFTYVWYRDTGWKFVGKIADRNP
jgi:hypothetical protein